MEQFFNFSPGPSTLPKSVLTRVQNELISYEGTSISILEHSHRGKTFANLYDETLELIRDLMAIPSTHEVFFLPGGASLQFSSIPMNISSKEGKAAYIDSGYFAHQAFLEGKKYSNALCLASSKDDMYKYIPSFDIDKKDTFDYVHITTNNTIYGTRYIDIPNTYNIPLVADASSNILSEPFDFKKLDLIYAGTQKNIGVSGLCLMIVDTSLLNKYREDCPAVLNWTTQCRSKSMYNTPNTFAIYVSKLVFEWLKDLGGVEGIENLNIEKSRILYNFLDNSSFFQASIKNKYRSRMNVVFSTICEELDMNFVNEASKKGLLNLKGHRLVGGMRASIYNAMPLEGVKKLVNFMEKFELENKKVF